MTAPATLSKPVAGRKGYAHCTLCATPIADPPVDHAVRWAGNPPWTPVSLPEADLECVPCGGSQLPLSAAEIDAVPAISEEAFRARMTPGFIEHMDLLMPVFAAVLSERKAAIFLALPYRDRCRIIADRIERGALV